MGESVSPRLTLDVAYGHQSMHAGSVVVEDDAVAVFSDLPTTKERQGGEDIWQDIGRLKAVNEID